MALLDEAVKAGARQVSACREVGIGPRTLQRWRSSPEDRRQDAPRRQRANQLSELERRRLLAVANSPEYRELSPKQIVPQLADKGIYLASESTLYRMLRAADQLKHRAASRPPSGHVTREHTASGPNQVWSWDITYLKSPIRGAFFFLYLVEDVWSRKIVGWAVHDCESPSHAAALVAQACRDEGAEPGLVLHADNGGPMKGATMLATLQRLGVVPSFSRPSVSNDNPYSEALFRTIKYRPDFPTKPFASLDAARMWVRGFTAWYNHVHLHSGIGFITPADRHAGNSERILERRREVYEVARRRCPERWCGETRSWTAANTVVLNPTKKRAAA